MQGWLSLLEADDSWVIITEHSQALTEAGEVGWSRRHGEESSQNPIMTVISFCETGKHGMIRSLAVCWALVLGHWDGPYKGPAVHASVGLLLFLSLSLSMRT